MTRDRQVSGFVGALKRTQHLPISFFAPSLCRFVVCLAVLFTADAGAHADEIRTAIGARYASIRIEDVREGRLHFRDVQGRSLNRPVADVGRLEITGWEAFNRAEAFLAERQYRLAVREYEAVLKTVEQAGPDAGRPKHRRELVLARLIAACDGEGRFDRAVECYILLCRTWGADAAGLEPRNVPARESAFFVAAMSRLADAIAEAGRTPAGELLRAYEARLKSGPATQATTRPPVSAPLSRPDRPAPNRTTSADAEAEAVQVARWIDAGQFDRARARIDEALRAEPIDRLAPWYYWQGRCLEAAAKDDADRLRAALAYMRVVVHHPDHARCAECLYRTAMIHLRAGHAQRVPSLLNEALRRSPADEIRKKCEAAIADMK